MNRQEMEQRDEFIENLQQLMKENRNLKHFQFFVGEAMKWYRSLRSGRIDSRVVILGTGIPEELILASGEMPFRILGGSQESTLWSDDLVPRDTDPVSRSVLGFVQCLTQAHVKGDIQYVVPAYSDSMRKIACHLKQEGQKVHVVDFPPIRPDELAQKKWIRQMVQLTETVAEHLGNESMKAAAQRTKNRPLRMAAVHLGDKSARSIAEHLRGWPAGMTAGNTPGRLTAASMKAAIRTTSRARIALHEFCLMAPEYDMLLSTSARLLICNSYYYTQDLVHWTEKLRMLMNEIRVRAALKGLVEKDQPKVLLMGSPVYFPNDKIPRLLSESGLRIWRQEDASLSVRHITPKVGRSGRSLRKMTEAVALAWFRADTSPAYLKNEAMRRGVRALRSPWTGQPIEGVVFHVLKGQIEQDFELSYYEELLEKADIPVFRLETDYQYQDVEQLRIRMEAFTEMLNQKRYHSKKEVV